MANKKKVDISFIGNTTNKKSNGVIDKLLNFFRIAPANTGFITPTEPVRDSKGNETGKTKPIEMPTTLQQAYQYFVQNLNTGVYRSNQYRFERYKECKYAVTVEPLLNSAIKIYVSESYNIQNGYKPIVIKAKDSKVEKEFYDWINRVGFTDNVVKDILYNLGVYGDAFWINQIDKDSNKGVTGITSLDPFLVANRLELNVGIVHEQQQWNQTALNLTNTYGALKQIYDIITGSDMNDISQFYKSYLFGYELKLSAEDKDNKNIKGVPPWAITHCRMFTTEQDFFPFGKPLFLNALASFKSYKTTQMLIDMLRVASFPREVINIKGDDNMDAFTRIQRVDEVRQFMENITTNANNQDGLAVGERYYTMNDLFSFDLLDPDIDMDKLGDLDKKEKSMIMSTGVPDSYLIPSEGAGSLGGENADGLYYLNKIFQRSCDSLRSAFLEGLTETYRMHLMLTGIADGDKTEFELSMPTNTDEYTDDKVSRDSDMLDLATNILSNLGQMVGLERGDRLPDEVIRDVLKMYMPIEVSKLDKWVKLLTKTADENEKENAENPVQQEPSDAPLIVPTGNQIGVKKGDSSTAKKEQDYNSRVNKLREMIYNHSSKLNEAYLDAKHTTGIVEGRIGNTYYYNNTYRLENNYEGSALGLLKEQRLLNRLARTKKLKEQDINAMVTAVDTSLEEQQED